MRKRTKEFPHGFRVQGLTIKDGKVLLMHRIKHGHEYYIVPGGGLEDGETIEEGVKREVIEEMSIIVNVGRPIFVMTIIGDSIHYIYLCEYLSGEPELGDFNELKSMKADSEDIYEPMWVPLKNIDKITLYPLEFRDWLVDNVNNISKLSKPFELTIPFNELRH